MKPPALIRLRTSIFAASLLFCPLALADTVITFGSVTQIANAGEIDLAGTMTYAINFSANDPVLTINGVNFTPDTAPPVGTSFVGPQNVTPWQTKPEFGGGADNNNLEQVFEDIRWANHGAAEVLEAHLPVTVGQVYKLQILFYGNHAENRRWDIEVEDAMAVDEITSLGVNTAGVTPDYSPNAGLVFSHTLTAADASLDVRFVGDVAGSNNEGGDRNPIWQAITVEHIVGDSDGDGMLDTWETLYFTNLSRNGTGDFDTDGLTDLQEFTRDTKPNDADTDDDTLNDGVEVNTHGTSPKAADTDGDGLTDPAEVNTHHTDPNLADTDLDGLTDSAEINTHLTNPTKADTDGDDFDDGFEIAQGTNPLSATSGPLFYTQARGFTGGDVGEGLDLDGTFLYAINVGTNGAPGQARDANFTDDAAPGVTVTAVNEIGAWNTPVYGDTANDDVLEMVIQSIRWTAAPGTVDATLTGLTPGRPYKLQLLFAEECCNRGFDILLNGTQIWDDYSPRTFQGGISNDPRGAVLVHGFLATSADLEIVLNGTGVTDPTLNDHNPTLCGITLEQLPPLADSDSDGLPDAWEISFFNNVAQTPTGDPDVDGLTNLTEFQRGTAPNDADSDNDGLNDGPEINTHQTDPKNADTDADGLNDGAEINTHQTDPKDGDVDNDTLTDGAEITTLQTNPKSIDTDNDGFNDPTETLSNSSPTDAASKPGATHIARVLGGDTQAEGLDLDGTFLYAFNVGTPGAAGQVRDADFTDDAQPGITLASNNEIGSWHLVEFGNTQNDDNLEFVFHSIRWTNAAQDPFTLNVSLDGLTAGGQYKLQLLFGEQCCANRGFDVKVEDVIVVDEFNTATAQLFPNHPYAGGAIVHSFTAPDTTLDIVLDGPSGNFADKNAILSGVTLEALTGATSTPLLMTNITRTTTPGGASIVLSFLGKPSKSYAIDFSTNLVTWAEVTDAVTTNASGVGTHTDTAAARTNGIQVYYRARDPVLKPTP